MAKAQKGEVKQRVEYIVELMAKGHRRTHILEYGAHTWGVSRTTVDRYIRRAKASMRRAAQLDIADLYAWSLAARMDMYAEARQNNDLRTALAIVRDIAKVTGLYDAHRAMPSFDLTTEHGCVAMISDVAAGVASGATDRKLLNSVILAANVALKAIAQQARREGDNEQYESAEEARKALSDCTIVELHERINRATQ